MTVGEKLLFSSDMMVDENYCFTNGSDMIVGENLLFSIDMTVGENYYSAVI